MGQARRVWIGLALVVCCSAMAAGATSWGGGLQTSYWTGGYANTFAAGLGDMLDVEVPALHLAIGGRAGVRIAPEGGALAYGADVFASIGKASLQGVSVRGSLFGIGVRVERSVGVLVASLGASVYRGGFDAMALRLNGLSGWGAGLVAGVTYGVYRSERLEARLGAEGQWLPVSTMSADGQVYRGRGAPFMDFSGIAASLSIAWAP